MMVEFEDCDPPPSERALAELERTLPFPLPNEVKRFVRESNGGRPVPNIFRCGVGDLEVSECLAVKDGPGSMGWTYELLANEKKAIPRTALPFAVDSGGNTFVVDCSGSEGLVSILLHDPHFRLHPLGVTFAGFWATLSD